MEHEATVFLPEPLLKPPFTLHMAGITYPNPRYRVSRPRGATYFIFEYIVAGRGTLRYDGMTYEPEAGDVYLLHCYHPCEYFSSRRQPWEKLWFNISGPLIAQLIDLYQLTGSVLFKQCLIEAEFRAALDIVFHPEPDAVRRLGIAMHGIISKLAEHRFRQRRLPSYPPEALRLKNYLDEHWQEKFSQAALCLLIGKSPAQMQRIFSNAFGCAPGQYVQSRRLHAACQYLENTTHTIRHIAGLLGFTDEYYFANWFKQRTGYAPRSWHPEQQPDDAAGTESTHQPL